MSNLTELLEEIGEQDLHGKKQIVFLAGSKRPVSTNELEATMADGLKGRLDKVEDMFTTTLPGNVQQLLVSVITVDSNQRSIDELRQPVKSALGKLGSDIQSVARDF